MRKHPLGKVRKKVEVWKVGGLEMREKRKRDRYKQSRGRKEGRKPRDKWLERIICVAQQLANTTHTEEVRQRTTPALFCPGIEHIKHRERETHPVHGGSSPSRCSSCSGPRRSGSPGRGDAWSARHTGGHCSCDSVQWPPYKTPHQDCERGRREGRSKVKEKEGIQFKISRETGWCVFLS